MNRQSTVKICIVLDDTQRQKIAVWTIGQQTNKLASLSECENFVNVATGELLRLADLFDVPPSPMTNQYGDYNLRLNEFGDYAIDNEGELGNE